MLRQSFSPNASPRIMLVSACANDAVSVVETLRDSSAYEVDVCNDLELAIRSFSTVFYDMVLLDESYAAGDIAAAVSAMKCEAEDRVVPVIMLLRREDSSALQTYINAGADDFLSHPFRPDVLLAKLRLCNQMRLMQATLLHQRDQIRLHNDHLLQEQQVAKRIYDNITSGGCLSAENIRYFMSPLAMFNGDILVAAMRPSGNMLVLLGDFTGHGLPAAIGAIPLASTFYGMAHKGFEPEDILREINQKIKAALPVGFFCCACMVELNFHEHTILVWNGGMPDVYLWHQSAAMEVIPSSHVALGIMDDRLFDARFKRYSMEVGDRFFLWTDGIIEACNPEGKLFGDDNLRRVFDGASDDSDLMSAVCMAVDDFIGEGSNSDDVSIVEITMVDISQVNVQERPTLAQTTQSAPTDWTMRFEITPRAVRAGSPIPMILNMLLEVPGLRQHSSSIYTILTELYSNALEHGILGLDSAIKHSVNGFVDYYAERDKRLADVNDGKLAFELQHEAMQDGGALCIRVMDSGNGFDYASQCIQKNTFSGRGINLVHQLCESLHYCGAGNEVRAVYHWSNYQ